MPFVFLGYIHVMKRSLLYFLLVSIFSCSKPETKTDKPEAETIRILGNHLELLRLSIAKHQRIFSDPMSEEASKNAETIHLQSNTALIRLNALNYLDDKRIKIDSSIVIFDDFKHKTTVAQSYIEKISKGKDISFIPVMPEITDTSVYKNSIALLAYSIKCLEIVKAFISPFCGVLEDFDLETRIENKTIKLGETIRCLNYFNRYDYESFDNRKLFFEHKTHVKEIRHNNSIIKPKNLTSRFDNGYIEFTPTQAGSYSITFSKTIERVNRKIETYESRVEFTVLP